MKYRPLLILLLCLALLSGCAGLKPDPHKGMVEVSDGMGGTMWVNKIESLPENTLDPALFSVSESGLISYAGEDCTAVPGVDVSYYQGEIDWHALAAQGIRFALLRIGYRGYTQGQLFTDESFETNLQGARDAGILCGVYFFSQAVTADEAREEAEQVLAQLNGRRLELPVFFDWEPVAEPDSRTQDVYSLPITDCAAAFCTRIEEGGYQAGVYFFRSLGYHQYDLAALSEWTFWSAALGDHPDFYYAHSFWQYSITARLDGVAGDLALDLWLIPNLTAPEDAS